LPSEEDGPIQGCSRIMLDLAQQWDIDLRLLAEVARWAVVRPIGTKTGATGYTEAGATPGAG
jgi:hypothetical protein